MLDLICETTHCANSAPPLTKPTVGGSDVAEQIILDVGPETKVCSDCKQRKLISEFNKKHGKPRWHCKECHRAQNKKLAKELYKKNKDHFYWSTMKSLYGLTPEAWQEIFDSQNGLCALCKKLGRGGGHRRLNVDHCHETGHIRGFLCVNCNTALGVLGDTPEKLKRVLHYLENRVHEGRPPRPRKPRKKRPPLPMEEAA